MPLSLYDLLGYLTAGVLYMLAAEQVLGLKWLETTNPPLQLQVFWLILAYAAGHANAQWASWLLEKHVARRLGAPSEMLFGATTKHRFFRHYRAPLPAATAQATLDKYERMTGLRQPGEDMFLFCFHLVKEECPQALARLNTFVSVYGFARNLSFAALVLAVGFTVAGMRGVGGHSGALAATSLLIAVTLFYRYLKFYRHFSVEVFASFRASAKETRA